MTLTERPQAGDYVVLQDDSADGRVLLGRVQPSGVVFPVLATFASVAGALRRFEHEAQIRAAKDGVHAFRRDDEETYTLLPPLEDVV